MPELHPQCALCPYDWSERYCRTPGGKAPENCPSIRMKDALKRARAVTAGKDVLPFACEASRQEAAGYANREQGYASVKPCKPRIQETVSYTHLRAHET